MNCHIVPKAYLKSWKLRGSPLFTFPKDELNSKGKSHSIEMKGTSLAKTNRYILKPEECYGILEYKNEFVSLFEQMKKYKIEYKGNHIQGIESFMRLYPYINDWTITDDSDNRMSNSKIKAELEHIWETQTQKSIENYFNRAIEDKWNNLLSYVKTRVLFTEGSVPANYRDTLIEFMAIQRSCTLYSISIRLSGYTRTLSIRRSASAVVRPVASTSSFEMLLRWASFSFASCSRFA